MLRVTRYGLVVTKIDVYIYSDLGDIIGKRLGRLPVSFIFWDLVKETRIGVRAM